MQYTELTDASPMPYGRHKDKEMSKVPATYLLAMYEARLAALPKTEDSERGVVARYIENNREAIETRKRGEKQEGKEDGQAGE